VRSWWCRVGLAAKLCEQQAPHPNRSTCYSIVTETATYCSSVESGSMGNSCGSASSSVTRPSVRQRKSAEKSAAYEQPIFQKMAMTSSFHGALMAVGTSTQELLFMSRKRRARQKAEIDNDEKSKECDQQQRSDLSAPSKQPHARPFPRSLSSMFFNIELLSPSDASSKGLEMLQTNQAEKARRESDVSTNVESVATSLSTFDTEDDVHAAGHGEVMPSPDKLKGNAQHRRSHSNTSNTSVDWREAEGSDPAWRLKLSNLRTKYDWDDLPLEELVDAQVGEAKNISILRRIGNNTLPRRKFTPPRPDMRVGVGVGAGAGVRGRCGLPPSGLHTVAPQVV
jgi:hypothetical protein